MNKFANNGKNIYFPILLIVFGTLSFVLFWPFINIIVIAFVLIELFYPVYKRLHKWLGNAAGSAILSTIVAFLVVIIPVAILILVSAGEAVSFTRQAQTYVVSNNLISEVPTQIVNNVNNLLTSVNVPSQFRLQSIDLKILVTDIGNRLTVIAGDIAAGILTGGLGLLFQIFLLIISMIYIFQLRADLLKSINRISPLDNEIDELFYNRFVSTTQAVVKGTVLVALAQATAVIIPMLLMGVGSPVLLWIIMVILSLIPVGSGLVWAPVGIALIVTGQPLAGIFLVLYSAIIINVIDSVLRPIIMKNSTQLHPFVTLFSVLGGISTFGMIGILYGPIIIVLFNSLLSTYNQAKHEEASESIAN